jgi:hypothetical protein
MGGEQQFLAQTAGSKLCFLPHPTRRTRPTGTPPLVGGKNKGLFGINTDPDLRSLTKGI